METSQEAEATYLRTLLEDFLKRNPEANITAEGGATKVTGLWGEDEIEMPVSVGDTEVLETLNSVRLPPRFTAIWHEDTRRFEAIFGVLRSEDCLLERSFEFRSRDNVYQCSFAASSQRLRAIARTARPSTTRASAVPGRALRSNFRNLLPYYHFEHTLADRPDSDFVKTSKPTSFWIQGVEQYSDDGMGELARNLNFHMSYFDRNTPTIAIHEEATSSDWLDDQYTPAREEFPNAMFGRDIDQHLLILWESAEKGDPFLRFIQYYQILEFAGFYHVKEEVRRKVEQVIAAPDAAARPDKASQQVVEAMSLEKRSDREKIDAVIAECVDLGEMWYVLQGSLEHFSEKVVLDGDFVLPGIVRESMSYEEFEESWNDKFLPALHKVRNALVHAREARQSTMITPTTANQNRLAPWLLPLSQIAARVMLHSRL